jgi:hypothetical protein
MRMEHLTQLFGVVAKIIRQLITPRSRAAYRPERHYMRGAGPKSKRSAGAAGDRKPNA